MYPDNSHDGVGGYPMSIYKNGYTNEAVPAPSYSGIFTASGHYGDGELFTNYLFCESDKLPESRTDLHDDLIFYYGMTRHLAMINANLGICVSNDFTITSVGNYV